MYIRLSREDGDKQESESIGNQRKILQRYVKENNLCLVKEYVDDGISGTTFDRPSFNELLQDIENKTINMVITKDLSRLGRDYIKTGFYLEDYFPKNNIRYVAITDGIDTYIDSTNNDITPFKAIMNDMYAKDISKKIRSVLKEKQKQGEYMCSTPAYGYKRHPTTFFCDTRGSVSAGFKNGKKIRFPIISFPTQKSNTPSVIKTKEAIPSTVPNSHMFLLGSG